MIYVILAVAIAIELAIYIKVQNWVIDRGIFGLKDNLVSSGTILAFTLMNIGIYRAYEWVAA